MNTRIRHPVTVLPESAAAIEWLVAAAGDAGVELSTPVLVHLPAGRPVGAGQQMSPEQARPAMGRLCGCRRLSVWGCGA